MSITKLLKGSIPYTIAALLAVGMVAWPTNCAPRPKVKDSYEPKVFVYYENSHKETISYRTRDSLSHIRTYSQHFINGKHKYDMLEYKNSSHKYKKKYHLIICGIDKNLDGKIDELKFLFEGKSFLLSRENLPLLKDRGEGKKHFDEADAILKETKEEYLKNYTKKEVKEKKPKLEKIGKEKQLFFDNPSRI